MHRTRTIWALCALALSACSGDDGTGPTGDLLTQGEITALMSSIGSSAGDLDPVALGIDAGGGQFSLDLPCAQGGSMTGSGSATPQSGDRLGFDMSIRYRDCRQPSGAGVFTLNGDFRQQGSFLFDETMESLEFDFDLSGDFDWSLGERSGSCEIDVEIAFAQPASFILSGTICGEPVDSLG